METHYSCLFSVPRILLYPAGIIRSQTVSTFWRQLILTDTRGLDLMRLSMRFSFMQELCITLAKWSCAGWVTSVLMPCRKCMHVDKLHPFEQSTWELWAATPFRVRKFNFASDLITSFFCLECVCNINGTAPGFVDTCNYETGQCKCLSNVIGIQCDKCADGFWNLGSGNGCQKCDCCGEGSTQATCNQVSKPASNNRGCIFSVVY